MNTTSFILRAVLCSLTNLKFTDIFGVEKRLVLTIEPNDYITKSGADGTIKLYVKGMVSETGQSFATQDVVELTKPKIKVTVSQCGNHSFHLLTIYLFIYLFRYYL